MRKYYIKCWLILCMLYMGVAYAQNGQISITGMVTDEGTKLPMAGVTVTVKGTSVATQTDESGNYKIQAPGDAILVFSFIGYNVDDVPVNNRLVIDKTMVSVFKMLDEVVIIGYGSQREKDLTSAITTIKAADITKTPNAQPMQALQGRVAGVQIISNGAPGASPTVRLRGIGSFEGNSAPLYVVDGMFFDNIDFLNPNDIQTISVLKDASASAIYGVRAGNGVVLIETKSGRLNQPTEILYDGYFGIQNPQNVLKMANTQQFVQYINETGSAADISFVQNAMQRYGRSRLDPNIPNVNTDWYHEIMSPAPIQNHALSFTGGGDATRFSVGGSYFRQDGLMNDTRNNYQRLNFRTKIDSRVRDWLDIGGNFNVSTARQFNGDNGAWFRSYFAVPILPVFDESNENGAPHKYANAQHLGYRGTQNPFYALQYSDSRNHVAKVLGSFNANIRLWEDKLSFKTQYNYGLGFVNARRVDFEYNDGVTQHNSGMRRQNNANFDQVWDNFLTYNDQFDRHNLNVVLGQSYRSEYNELLFASGQGIIPIPDRNAEHFWYLSNATDLNLSDIGDAGGNTINARLNFLSYFGRVAYNYDDRYLLYGTFRRDGNNKFQKRWGNFATVGAGWVVSEEDFFDVEGIDFLKFRGSWGQLGNDAIRPSVGLPTIEENNTAINDVRYIGRRLNPTFDLIAEWETTVETNLGMDARFLNNRLSLEADYFIRDTRNLAVSIIPPVFRATERRSVGEIRNTGFEMSLNWNEAVNDKFSYYFGGNIATLKNEVISLGGADGLDGGSAEFRQRSLIGQPYQAFYGYEVTGVFQNEAQIANSGYTPSFITDNNIKPGDLIYRDVNGDGLINDQDRQVLGSFLPKFTYGINGGFQFKQFDFSFLAQGQSGYSILNRKRGEMIFTNDTNIDADLATNMWRGEGTSNQYPSAAGLRKPWNQRMSSYFVEDGSYFRIQNVRLSYTFFGPHDRESKFPETRVTFTADRPLTLFKYNGFNPEVANGVDREVYPIPAIYTLGLTIKL